MRTDSDRTVWTAPLVLAAGLAAAYHRTLAVPFLLDDDLSIVRNRSIRHAWPVSGLFSPPPAAGVGGRPLLNLSFAFNQQVLGGTLAGYHLVNLAIHALSAWILFLLVRRTLRGPALGARFGAASGWLALAISCLWAWHPVQTESVTYLSQRAESLAGLLALLALYLFARGCAATPKVARWFFTGSVAACLGGMATKEVVAVVPILALLYDRCLVSGSVAEAWRRRSGVYLALAATWLPLAWLMTGLKSRNVGLGLGISAARYGLTECRVICRYLLLAFWPHPLVFDYGPTPYGSVQELWPYAALAALLLAATGVALIKRPAAGFALAWFLVALAPTSSVIPIVGQPMAESRLYLALAGVVSLAVLGAYCRFGRLSLAGWALIALALVAVTGSRNRAYASDETLWRVTAAQVPANPRAHLNLGYALVQQGRLDDAVAEYETALQLSPNNAEARNDYGDALAKAPNRAAEAVAEFQEAVRLKPDFAAARYNLGTLLEKIPARQDEAIRQLEEAVRLDPGLAQAHYNLGTLLERAPGRAQEAEGEYRKAIALEPDFGDAHQNLGNRLAVEGRLELAVAEFRAAARLKPKDGWVHFDLGNVLKGLPGRREEAIAEYRVALALGLDAPEVHHNLGTALRAAGRREEAAAEYEKALRLRPGAP